MTFTNRCSSSERSVFSLFLETKHGRCFGFLSAAFALPSPTAPILSPGGGPISLQQLLPSPPQRSVTATPPQKKSPGLSLPFASPLPRRLRPI